MRKIILALMLLAATAIADVRLDFKISVAKRGCELVKWEENAYVYGTKYRRYAHVECKEAIEMPINLVGLKFIDVATNLSGKYVYIYGEL